jgi:hypothetical protein
VESKEKKSDVLDRAVIKIIMQINVKSTVFLSMKNIVVLKYVVLVECSLETGVWCP